MEQQPDIQPASPGSVETKILEAQVTEALRTCYDPEIPVNIYELGLIYSVTVSDAGAVEVVMTLTTPYCPAAQSLPAEVDQKVRGVAGVTSSTVRVVWDPPWSPNMMSEAARLELGIF
jgi:FeS assembly SUF system protein